MKPAKILIIEDNPITRKLFRVAVESAGYLSMESPDGRTALDLVARDTPDLILQDLMLPDIQGFELLKQLRALPGVAKVPILAVSGLVNKMEEAKAAGVGFTDFLTKPIEPSRLIEAIESYLPLSQLESPRPGQGYRLLVVDDDAIQRKLMHWHFNHLGFEVSLAEDGTQALEVALKSFPDAIVSDVLMPGLDGFMLCMEIRSHARLAQLPVILTSAVFIGEEDRQLAYKAGANAYVSHTPSLHEITVPLLEALRSKTSPPKPTHPLEILTSEHRYRVIRQLERQASYRMDLAQAFSVQAAQLSVLAGVSEVFTRTQDIEKALGEILYRYLEATSEVGTSAAGMGAVYLLDPEGHLNLQAQLGFSPSAQKEFFEFGGYTDFLSEVLKGGEIQKVPSEHILLELGNDLLKRAEARSIVVMPLMAGGEKLGMIVMASQKIGQGDDLITFAKAMRGQLSQTIALARALAKISASERRSTFLSEASLQLAKSLDYGTTVTTAARLLEDSKRYNGQDNHEFALELARRSAIALDNARLYQSAQEAIHLRDEFLMVASHELRTPITPLKLWIQAILHSFRKGESQNLSENRVFSLLKSADKQINRLSNLIDDLLTVSRLASGQLHFLFETADLCELIHEVAKHFTAELIASGSTLEVDVGGPIVGRWDRLRIEETISSLLSNAIRYGAGRPIKISAKADESHVTMIVEDHGIGIGSDDQARVFWRFERAVSSRNYGGLGLGLYLARQIIEGHGGSIRVESMLGKGSKFIVELPMDSMQATNAAPERMAG